MSSMGMDKNGNQTIALSTWVKLLNFTVRAGYPSTVIVDHELQMDAASTGQVRWRGAFSGALGTQQFRVVHNGVTVIGTVNSGVIGTVNGVAVANGDTLELQAFANTSGFSTVTGGSANTWLEYNQTTTNYDIDASTTVTWGRSAALAVDADLDAATTVTWGLSSEVGADGALETAATTVVWGSTADIYQGQEYTLAAEQTWNWNATAELAYVPAPTPLPSVFAVNDVALSIHTIDGRMVGDIPCTAVQTFAWGREANEVSAASMDISTQAIADWVEDIRAVVHWMTVWHDNVAVWTGMILIRTIGTRTTSISARDTGTLMWRTRVPITRTWVDTSPQRVADTLWKAMLEHHGLRASPIVLPGLADNTFTITAKSDQRMMHQLMDDLTKVGLQWTVVAGRPVLGKFTREPIAQLEQCDFMVELQRRMDGTATYNDVRVQGQNWAQTAVVDLAGLRMQTLVSLDDMFGASNIQRATQQYAKETAQLRDQLVVPPSASLHPSAPVTLDDLVPGKVFLVHHENIAQLMRLDQMNVTGGPDGIDVQVGLVALEQDNAIVRLTGGGGNA